MSVSFIQFLPSALKHLHSTNQPKPIKLTGSLANEALIYRPHLWQEDLLQIGWPTQILKGNFSMSWSTSFISLYLFPMNAACLAFSVRFIFISNISIQSRDSIQISCSSLYTSQTTVWVYLRFSKKKKRTTFFWEALNLFVSYNISPDPVIKLYDSDPKDLFLIKISALMQLLSLDTVVLIYDFT